ncbi:MAG: hypothetical protein K2Q22_08540 [Cytophagales bacterium]|nr:hypothetical protein [Cytophagales bacterium]
MDLKIDSTKTDWTFSLYSFLICIFLVCFRDIEFLKNPTFWADEGTHLFTKSLRSGWSSLFVTHAGYLQIPQSFVNIISSQWVRLEDAPILTAWVSIGICLIAPAIILWGESIFEWLPYERLLLAVVTIVACEDGNSYTTMNYHFIFSWISVLLFFEKTEGASNIKVFIYSLLMLIGSLSGPLPSIIGLFYLIRFIQVRNRTDFIYLTVVSIGLSVSVYFFLSQYFANDPAIHKSRFVNIVPEYSVMRFFLMSLIGNTLGYFESISRVGAFLAYGFFIYIFRKFASSDVRYRYLIWVMISYAIIPFVLSGSMAGGTRYIYTANMLFFVLLLFHSKSTTYFSPTFAFASWLVLAALISYTPKHSNIVLLKRIDWKSEVAKWRKDPNYEIKIYPYQGWDTTKPWLISLKDLKNEVK